MRAVILDPCCGGKMFYFDKDNPNVLFCDNRQFSAQLCDWRSFEVNPDMVIDFINLPFSDAFFYHVVFDPPHLLKAGNNSWLVKKYGKLPKNYASFLKAGFNECWRVLKLNGTLNFKWSEQDITVAEILKIFGKEPIYGQKIGKHGHWLTFVKT